MLHSVRGARTRLLRTLACTYLFHDRDLAVLCYPALGIRLRNQVLKPACRGAISHKASWLQHRHRTRRKIVALSSTLASVNCWQSWHITSGSKRPGILNDGNHTGDLNRTEQTSVKSCPIAPGAVINSLKARCSVTSVGLPWECLRHRARTCEYHRNLR